MIGADRYRTPVRLTRWCATDQPTAGGRLALPGCAAGRYPLGSGAMRPSRMLLLALAGLVAVHVFMLAGHGSGNSLAAGISSSAEHTTSPPSSRSTPLPDDKGHGGFDLTVACLAVLVGFVLLGPRRAAQAATARHDRPAVSRDWAPRGPGGPSNPIPRGALHLADVSRPSP
jgi:hypothetical protein